MFQCLSCSEVLSKHEVIDHQCHTEESEESKSTKNETKGKMCAYCSQFIKDGWVHTCSKPSSVFSRMDGDKGQYY
jgi:hypothetical protein